VIVGAGREGKKPMLFIQVRIGIGVSKIPCIESKKKKKPEHKLNRNQPKLTTTNNKNNNNNNKTK
jgi:hypothetical protein